MKTGMKHTLWGGAAAAAVALVVAGGAFFPTIAQAQTATSTDTVTSTVTSALSGTVAPDFQQRGKGTPNGPLGNKGEQSAALAAALGITTEEYQAAQVAAQGAAIDQQVADGWLTQLQADELKANLESGSGRMGGDFGRGHGAAGGSEIDFDALLADALGITTDELDAARTQVYEDQLAQAVTDGTMTQEQADLALARRALQAYVAPLLQSAYDDAVAAAVSDGIITQAQADALAAQGGYGMRGFGPGMGDMGGRGMERGGHGGGRHGGPSGSDVAPDMGTPDSTDSSN